MKYVITTCCKEKRLDKGKLPAIERYLEPRIHYAHKKSKELGCGFLIFSGKFGILEPHHKIPYYDLKLEKEMVKPTVKKVCQQLKILDATEIIFYGKDKKTNPDWLPYYEVIERACQTLNIKLTEEVI